MAHLVVLVLDNLTQFPHVLEAWEEAGVSGVTICREHWAQPRAGRNEGRPTFDSLAARYPGRQ